MSMHIVDDEQRSDRRAIPMRPLGSGLEGASASLALLDDVHRHRLRRAALHLPLPSQERGPFQFSDRLLGRSMPKRASPNRRNCEICENPTICETIILPPTCHDHSSNHRWLSNGSGPECVFAEVSAEFRAIP